MYFDTELFLDDSAYNPSPTKRMAYGASKMLLSYVSGKFVGWNRKCIDEIMNMPSFRGMEQFMSDGKDLKPTIDCFTWTGCVLMANKDETRLNSDYARIEEMCTTSEL